MTGLDGPWTGSKNKSVQGLDKANYSFVWDVILKGEH
jgi:hypothetical protein